MDESTKVLIAAIVACQLQFPHVCKGANMSIYDRERIYQTALKQLLADANAAKGK